MDKTMMLKHCDAELRELVASKMPMKEIAKKLGVTYSAIYSYCNNHGIRVDQERAENWDAM